MAGTTRQHVFIFSACHTFPGLVLCFFKRVPSLQIFSQIHNFSSPSNKTCTFISTKLPRIKLVVMAKHTHSEHFSCLW